MARSLWTLSTLFTGLMGCSEGPIDLYGVRFLDRPTLPLTVENLEGEALDDGFGSAVVSAMGKVWIGAPHGPTPRVYVWDGTDLTVHLEGLGRLGSHLSGSSDGLWASAPTASQVFNADGEIVHEGQPGIGIALSDQGHIAIANGWIAADGTTGSTPHRPSALYARENTLGIGMAHGEIAFLAGDRSWSRPISNDEAGFSVSSGKMGDTDVWVVGAPASGHVYALDIDSLETVGVWKGNGRFGHAVTVVDINRDQQDDLLVGAPFDGPTGSVTVFYGFNDEGVPIDTAGCRSAGTSLHASNGRLLMGAPGSPTAKGRVLMLAL